MFSKCCVYIKAEHFFFFFFFFFFYYYYYYYYSADLSILCSVFKGRNPSCVSILRSVFFSIKVVKCIPLVDGGISLVFKVFKSIRLVE